MSQLIYTFDSRKLVKNLDGPGTLNLNFFNDIGEAEAFIKQRFKVIFENNAQEIFQTLGETRFQQLFGVDNVDDFIQILPNTNGVNSIFSYIKVE